MMREKKNYTVITFHTTTEAMIMEKCCGEQNIPGRMIPTPREISASCGLAWRMSAEDYAVYAEKIQKLDLQYDQIAELLL